ncbi:phage baseplate assembly protein [Pantoea sp. BAV 3049]|uniref:phage baseplate assembly protein n=1 Tax=Pantoea sp. BAV 3049 TaxID=2654188 RepID=UPI00131EBBDA|nr:phage tail protein [Pantoea sp. BAV 3049]
MPTQNNSTTTADERLTLTVGGVSHSDWMRTSVVADFLTPAGQWQLDLGISGATLPAEVKAGARAVLSAGSDILMTGLIDDINHAVLRGQHVLNLSGRDEAAVLLDCSAPIFTAQEMTLQEVIARIVRPLGISKIDVRADSTTAPKKFSIQPGETAWSALQKAAEVSGLWPWISPDGTLVIGGPDYSAEPVASLVLNRDGTGNLLNLTKHTSIAGRYSEVTVLTQGHATTQHDGVRNYKGTSTDAGFSLYRPHIQVEGDTDTDEEATARARKLLSDSRLKALTITAVVRGVHTESGAAWIPGQRVAIKSAIHDIDGIYFLMGREIRGGRGMPLTTTLTFKEDGIWIPDAYPRSRHKKKGKKTTEYWTDWQDIK